MVTTQVALSLGDGWAVGLSAGGILSGELRGSTQRLELEPGWVLGVHGTRRLVPNAGAVPFVDLVLAIAVAGVSTREHEQSSATDLLAVDLRCAALVGWNLPGGFSPYGAVRVFGGPVIWSVNGEKRAGTDQYHVQFAVGASFKLPAGLLIFAEYAPGFERALSTGIGVRFEP